MYEGSSRSPSPGAFSVWAGGLSTNHEKSYGPSVNR